MNTISWFGFQDCSKNALTFSIPRQMDSVYYFELLVEALLGSSDCFLGESWSFYQDNDPCRAKCLQTVG